MRIAFVSFDFAEYCIQHANGLLSHGEVLLMLPKDLIQPYRSLIEPDVQLHTFAKPRLRQPLRQLACIRRMIRRIREFEPDVIHFQRGHLWFNFALPLLRRYPRVLTIHDPRHHVGDRGSRNTPQFVMDFGYRQADHVIVHGSQLKETVCTEIGIAADKIHVVPHIAIGQRQPAPSPPASEPLILFFGRIWKYKGLDFLIRAQPLINRAVPEARIMICGNGEDFQPYRQLMSEPDKFIVHNHWISDEQRTNFFQQASIVVLPYIEATQSGVVPVAYAHSRPVVATNTGGLPDIVDHGRTGLLVEPRNEVALAEAVVQLLQNRQLRIDMGIAGKRKLDSELSREAVTAQTVAVYRQAIADRRQTTNANNQRRTSEKGAAVR